MNQATSRVEVVSTGAYLPGDAITNADMERLVGPLPPDVLEGIQVQRRHWMIDPATGEHRDTNSAMATKAARQALDRAGMEPADVDLLVVSTASPEYHLPPTSAFVQEQLGLRKCASMDIRSGCAGFVEGLAAAASFLASASFRTALVIGSEAISPLLAPLFLGKDPDSIRMRDRMNPYNFGDGAGAFVLRALDESDGPGGLLGWTMACLGGEKKPGMQVVGGGTHAPVHEQLRAKRFVELKVDVVEAGRFTPFVLIEAMADMSAACGLKSAEVDAWVIPEGNAGYVVEELEEAGLATDDWITAQPAIVENLADVGATGSAAVPLAADDAWVTGRITPGDRVMLLGIETSKWKYAGMGVAWTAQYPG